MRTDTVANRGLNYWVAMILGWVLVAVGLLGFVMDPILGLFDVDVVHNNVHLLTGAVLLAGAYVNAGEYARPINITLGIVYGLVAVVGFVSESTLTAIMDTNMADHWLHLLLGIVLVGVGFADRATVNRPMAGTPR